MILNLLEQNIMNRKLVENVDVREFYSFELVGQIFVQQFSYTVVTNKEWAKDKIQTILAGLDTKINSMIVGNLEIDKNFYLVLKTEDYHKNINTKLIYLLTEREIQIATLAAHGMSNKKIASHLCISEWTVSTHLRRIFSKLNVDSRAAMVYQCASLIEQLHL
jgi:DNA-binding NarL/FixJ family response regulator